MKLLIFTLLVILTFSCKKEQPELHGRWNAIKYLSYPSDTISIEEDLDTNIEQITLKTDSGIMVISHIRDSVISIEPTTKAYVMQFHFDDETHGVLSIYEMDSKQTPSNEDPRYTADNHNFSAFTNDGRTYLIVDHHFSQFGRALDTVEYRLISANELLLSKDTLMRMDQL
ncbi:MAG: hypothetical protein AAGA66_19335 [Bacteroidota bacterium]